MAWMLYMKVFFISTGVLFTALGLTVSVPLLVEFVAAFVPVMCNFFSLCFKPPYLHIIINGIIIIIAASSRFHRSDVNKHTELTQTSPSNFPPSDAYEIESPPEVPCKLTEPPAAYNETIEEATLIEVRAIVVNGASVSVEDEDREAKAMDDMDSTWRRIKKIESMEIPSDNLPVEAMDDMDSTCRRIKKMESMEIPADNLSVEKSLISATFGHRKPLEASPEGGRSLTITKPKWHETPENTWKAIREGQDMPSGRHVKKCETWDNRGHLINMGPLVVRKSETLKDRTNELADSAIQCSLSPMMLQKEGSLSQDELNRRVEAFIRKFNEEMRLQRQASLNQYKQLINH